MLKKFKKLVLAVVIIGAIIFVGSIAMEILAAVSRSNSLKEKQENCTHHVFVSTGVKEKGSCTKSQIEYVQCILCQYESTEDRGYRHVETYDPTDEPQVNATCTTEGYMPKTICSECGVSLDEGHVVEMIPHSYEHGICSVCSAEAVYKITVSYEDIPLGQYNASYGDKLKDVVPDIEGLKEDGLLYFGYLDETDEKVDISTEITKNMNLKVDCKEYIPINTPEEFLAIKNNPRGTYVIESHLNFKGEVIAPFDNFYGYIDANNVNIYNFSLAATNLSNGYGLFRANEGTLRNFTIYDATFNYSHSGSLKSHIGGFVGDNRVSGVIEYCNMFDVLGNVTITSNAASDFSVGGLVGRNVGVVRNSYANCDLVVDISNESPCVSYNTNYCVSPFVGRNSGSISKSYNRGDLQVKSRGNLTKVEYLKDIHNNYNEFIGGIAGLNTGGTIIKSYSEGQVSSRYRGTNGVLHQNLSIYSYNYDNVGHTQIGGFVGQNEKKGVITECFSNTDTYGNSNKYCNLGGFVGYNTDTSKISNSYSTGEVARVDAESGFDAGGFAGGNNATISECYATGVGVTATANSNVGGFVGANGENGTISKCIASLSVAGGSGNVGNFVGKSNGVINKGMFNLSYGVSYSEGANRNNYLNTNKIEAYTLAGKNLEDAYKFLFEVLYWDTEVWVDCSPSLPELKWNYIV